MRWFFAALGQYGTRVLFLSVFVGLLLPDLASLLRPLLPPGVAAILALGLVRIDWTSMVSYARRPVLVGLVVAWLMVAAPVAVWVVFKLFALPDALETAVVLMACAPPILGSIAIALLLGLDAPLAIVCGLVSTLLTPITVPPLALELLGLALDVSTLEFMAQRNTLLAEAIYSSTQEISDLRNHLQDVRKQGLTDGLTQVANRRAFDIRLGEAIQEAKALQNTFTLVMKKHYDQRPALRENENANTGAHVGIIGCGNFAYNVVAYYLKRGPGAVIRGTMDRNIDRAISLFEDYGAAYYCDDAQKIVEDDRIDLVYICSNHEPIQTLKK